MLISLSIGYFKDTALASTLGLAELTYSGNMAITFGGNLIKSPARYCGLHGKNDAPSYCDIFTLNHDFYLDGKLIVRRGEIVHPECR